MKYKWLLLALVIFAAASCKKDSNSNYRNNNGNNTGGGGDGNTTTPDVFGVNKLLQSNMVVQRDKPFTIWGKAANNYKVSATASWNQTTFNTTAGSNGIWKITIPAASANNTPQQIVIIPEKGDTVTLKNILIGDVWVCSGQSNMVYPVDSISPFTGVIDFRQEIANANYPSIRALTIGYDAESNPASEVKSTSGWKVCSPQTVGSVSAIAYYFAQKLNTDLNVPIGIIVSAENGSFCQEWTNSEAIKNDDFLAHTYGTSSSLYNGMINPLTNLSVKGFIWYQGENNEHDDPSSYARLNAALIGGWRQQFNQGSLPFYYVQMTPFAEDYYTTTPLGGDTVSDFYAKFREGQASILSLTTNTGMAVTMDVGEVPNHHPRNKKPVGQRLALLALKNTYGENVQCYGPHYTSFTANGYTATVNYSPGTATGLTTSNGAPLTQFFFVAGTDHNFRKGTAVIQGNTIVITAPQNTPLPIQAVRYAFTNAPVTNLQNSAGLPAEPFRSDNWGN